MPYIKPERRGSIDVLVDELAVMTVDEGDVNYAITRLADRWLGTRRYNRINTVIGILACVQLEFYRRVAAGYEDEKCAENGDAYWHGDRR